MQAVSFLTTEASFPGLSAFMPFALEMVRGSCRGFGFGKAETDALTLAAEEVVAVAIAFSGPKERISLTLTDRISCVTLAVSCGAAGVELAAFNLAWKPDTGEERLGQLGLLLAAKMTDTLAISSRGSRLTINVSKERSYQPSAASGCVIGFPPQSPLRLEPVSRDLLQECVALVAHCCTGDLPRFLRLPGLAAALQDAGELQATVLRDRCGTLAGVVFRKGLSERCIEMFGPYMFCEDREQAAAALLINDCLQGAAQTGVRGVLLRHTLKPPSGQLFTGTGSVTVNRPDGVALQRQAWYHPLCAGAGSMVYSCEPITAWLKEHYRNISLPRDIAPWQQQGRAPAASSVFSTDIAHAERLATLRLLRSGADLQANLQAHLALLDGEGIGNIVVEVDNGSAEEMALIPCLAAEGFVPQLLVPYGGIGDLLLFSRERRI